VLAALILAGIVPSVIIYLGVQVIMERTLIAAQEDTFDEFSDEISRQLKNLMAEAAEGLTILQSSLRRLEKKNLGERAEENPDDWLGVFQTAQAFHPTYTDITLYSPQGRLIASTTYKYLMDTHRHLAFSAALGGHNTLTQPRFIPTIKGFYISLYFPLLDKSNVPKYVIVARIAFDRVWHLFSGIELGKGSLLLLLDDHGNLLSHPDKDRILTKFDESIPAEDWNQAEPWTYTSPDGIIYLAVSKRLDASATRTGQPWTILSLKPYDTILAATRPARSFQLGVALLSAIFISLLGIVLARKLAQPIRKAADAARQLSKGNLTTAMDTEGPVEIADLASAFNTMLAEVIQHRGQLEADIEHHAVQLEIAEESRRELTAYLASAYEAMAEAVLITDVTTGNIITSNKRLIEFFPAISPDAMQKGSAFMKAIAPQFRNPPLWFERWQSADADDEIAFTENWHILQPTQRLYAVFTAPIYDQHRAPFARLWMFRDISREDELEKSLRQSQKMEALGRLAGGIAHDFNNLLTAIMGNITLANLEYSQKKDPRPFLEPAQKASRRAAELVKQLQGFSRDKALSVGRTTLNHIAEEVFVLLQRVGDSRVEFQIKLAEKLWSTNADTSQLHQVIMNICVNALDAMSEGGQLTLRTFDTVFTAEMSQQQDGASEGDYTAIEIRDSGAGMTQSTVDRIFEPFFTTKPIGEGTGLGLSVSYGIVQKHQGFITCSSEVGGGTTFTVYLPRDTSGPDYLLRETSGPGLKPVPARGMAGKSKAIDEHILIIDDDSMVARVASRILQRAGYCTTIANSGTEGMRIFKEEQDSFDGILLDLNMPGLSGQRVFQDVRTIDSTIAIIISSGYLLDIRTFEEEIGMPPTGYALKPYEPRDFLASIRRALDSLAS
jgi:signal transduction histidine kinase/CheY-like chemotaxis protein